MPSRSINAYVLSNGCEKEFPDNTLTSFRVKFPFSLTLPNSANERWCIALNSISVSSNFKSSQDFNYLKSPMIIQFHSVEGNYKYDINYYNNKRLFEYKSNLRNHIFYKIKDCLNGNKEYMKNGMFYFYYNAFQDESNLGELSEHLKRAT